MLLSEATYNHSSTHSHTNGGVNHADSQLVRSGHLDTQRRSRELSGYQSTRSTSCSTALSATFCSVSTSSLQTESQRVSGVFSSPDNRPISPESSAKSSNQVLKSKLDFIQDCVECRLKKTPHFLTQPPQ